MWLDSLFFFTLLISSDWKSLSCRWLCHSYNNVMKTVHNYDVSSRISARTRTLSLFKTSVLYLTAAERVNFSTVICSHLDDGLSPFDVKAVQVKHEQGLRSEVMDELNVAVWAECWSLMLDESERGHYRPGECNTGTARQTWQFRSVPNLQPPPKRSCTHSSQAIYNREPGRADSFYSVWKSVLKN